MKTTNTPNRLAQWLLWPQLKFAILSFICFILIGLTYGLIAGAIYGANPSPAAPLSILLFIGFISCLGWLIRRLPRTQLGQESFIAINNAQMFVISVAFILSSIFIVRHMQQILFQLMMPTNMVSTSFLILASLSGIFYLYLLGIVFTNIYVKFIRAYEMGIPAWKIIFSMPFGFSALWTAGYMLNTPTIKKSDALACPQWYKKITKQIITRPINTIIAFVAITLLSGFFYGFSAVLLTYSFALIFGIWVINVGRANFTKNISKKYSTYAVIVNILIILSLLTFGLLYPNNTQNVQIEISDTNFTVETIE